MKRLLITGLYRSGTTLLQKILNHHPQMCVFPQPFPNFYFVAKNKFYVQKGLDRKQPLDHLFLERDYARAEFCAFLDSCSFSANDIDKIFAEMTAYSGQQMPALLQLHEQVVPGSFDQVYHQFFNFLANCCDIDDLSYIGAKEIICEEFIPFLLSRGNKVIVIIRDPRDVLTSLNFGRGFNHTGDIRPTLYTLRQWRKSVSFCIAYQTHPNFTFIKYEDLVKNLWLALDKLTQFLFLESFDRDTFSTGVSDQNGKMWSGNSSFHDYSTINSASVGKFKENLSVSTIRYIESVCHPELHYLGYEFLYQPDYPDEDIITTFIEPFAVTHRHFDPDYSHLRSHINAEIQRLRHLWNEIEETEQEAYFIFPKTYQYFAQSRENVVR